MEKVTLPKSWLNRVVFHSSFCEEHTYKGEIKPEQKMIVDGEVVCPRCELEKETNKLKTAMEDQDEMSVKFRKYNMLTDKSILADETIRNVTFKSYKPEIQEEHDNKRTVMEAVKRYQNGEVFNLLLQGNQGVGKSHLGYAALQELRRKPNMNNRSDFGESSLFINLESMLRLIKESFRDKESKYTEGYFVELLSKVDYLVLDDLGAETGAIDTDKLATDFVQRILYAVSTTRQNKATILTTNLSSKQLFAMYDRKVVSRLLKNPKIVTFKEGKDRRISGLSF